MSRTRTSKDRMRSRRGCEHDWRFLRHHEGYDLTATRPSNTFYCVKCLKLMRRQEDWWQPKEASKDL